MGQMEDMDDKGVETSWKNIFHNISTTCMIFVSYCTAMLFVPLPYLRSEISDIFLHLSAQLPLKHALP